VTQPEERNHQDTHEKAASRSEDDVQIGHYSRSHVRLLLSKRESRSAVGLVDRSSSSLMSSFGFAADGLFVPGDASDDGAMMLQKSKPKAEWVN
jgi:hypothetical protein